MALPREQNFRASQRLDAFRGIYPRRYVETKAHEQVGCVIQSSKTFKDMSNQLGGFGGNCQPGAVCDLRIEQAGLESCQLESCQMPGTMW